MNILPRLFVCACIAGVAGSALTVGAQTTAPLERPSDIDRWITLGMTLRTDPAHGGAPAQLRQVRIDPKSFDALMKTGDYPAGAMLAASFHPVKLDESFTPSLYSAGPQTSLSIEVIDPSHPDGRRFYNFAGDAKSATAMAAGNSCAACHNANGKLHGTFGNLYTVTAGLVAKPN